MHNIVNRKIYRCPWREISRAVEKIDFKIYFYVRVSFSRATEYNYGFQCNEIVSLPFELAVKFSINFQISSQNPFDYITEHR